jgi:PAS domain-containing protein
MRGISMEPVKRLRRALFPVHGDQFAWRVASVAVSLISVALIALTFACRLRGAPLPSALLFALLAAFATVVLLLSKFLFRAQQEQGQTTGAFNTTERQFQSVYETALDAIFILDDQAICREANPAAEQLVGVERCQLIGRSVDRFYKDLGQFQQAWESLQAQKFLRGTQRL